MQEESNIYTVRNKWGISVLTYLVTRQCQSSCQQGSRWQWSYWALCCLCDIEYSQTFWSCLYSCLCHWLLLFNRCTSTASVFIIATSFHDWALDISVLHLFDHSSSLMVTYGQTLTLFNHY